MDGADVSSSRTLSDADVAAIAAALRPIVREEATLAAERLELRLRKQRPAEKRRMKAPEAAAQIAAEIATNPVNDVAHARASRALKKFRALG